ncbi:MAG: ribokinase [Dysgonamonadaceae bacterium]|jgi:ribokinase|nr:ribokinase [Dysgonamonadaceae bacterium]
MGIVVIGGSNTDMIIKSDRLPLPGQIVAGGQFRMNSGGKGANQAVAIARMGSHVSLITKTGNDLFGKRSLELYKSEGIATDYVFSDPDYPSGIALILMDASGEKCISIAQGAIRTLSVKEVEKARTAIETADILLMELEIPMETAEHIAEIASGKGVKVILNPSPVQAISQKLLQKVQVIIPNKTEAELMTSINVSDWDSARRAADRIHEKGVETVIITLGSKGALVRENGRYYEIVAEKVNAIDTTAAGDTFCGVFCVGLTENMSTVEAAKMACKAASITVTRRGIQESIPYRKEL